MYQQVNLVKPAIWHKKYVIDITEVFTELRLLKSEKKKEGAAQTKSTCITKEGKPTYLREVLSVTESTDSCKVLITGQGGMGKTTLLKYITHKWTTGDEHTFAGKILFLINIGNIKANTTFLDIIMKNIDTEEFILQKNLPPNSVKRFLANHTEDIVILLDGYDELQKDSKDPICLFKGLELEKSSVLITSRPDNTNDLVINCTLHIEVKGFNRQNIEKYILKHFHLISKIEVGKLLYKKLMGGYHKHAFELCSSPLLLLMICTMWEQKQHLPEDLSDLFKDLICCILSQYQNKNDDKTVISEIERIPKQYKLAILLLGECMYEGLKENKLSIDKYDLSKMTKNINSKSKVDVDLALKFGFVYEETPIDRGNAREIYTPPHKLISEALAGFYLSDQIKEDHLKAADYGLIRSNKYLNMTRAFTIGFLGAKAGKLLKNWLVIRASEVYSIAQCFRYIKEENEETVLKELDENMSTEMKSCCEQMCETFRSILKDDKSEHLFKLMKKCCIKYENRSERLEENALSLVDASSEISFRKSCRSVAHISVIVQGQLNEGRRYISMEYPLLRYISNWADKNINVLSAEMEYLKVNYSYTSVSLDYRFNSSFLIHLLTHSNQLSTLEEVDKERLSMEKLSAVTNELHKTNVKLTLTRLDINCTDLYNINGAVLGKLFEIAPKLNYLNVSNCGLSGDIVRAMIRECQSSGVQLNSCSLDMSRNGIDDALLGDILRVFPNLYSLNLAACGLSKASFNSLVNEFHEIKLCKLYFSYNYLGNLDLETFKMSLKKLPKLLYFDISGCNLSGSIVNKMTEKCSTSRIFKECMLDLKYNVLSNIEGKSLVRVITGQYFDYGNRNKTFRWSDYSLKCDNLEKLVESVGGNMTLHWERIDLSKIDLSLISGKTLACLLKISPHLIKIDMSNCRLSGSIVNAMMKECHSMNVVLKDKIVILKGNDLSGIEGKSLAQLVRVIPQYDDEYDRNGTFRWSDYAFTSDNLQKLVESVAGNMTLNWKTLDLSNINLSLISSKTLACLFKISPQLFKINMKNCRLSGSIVNAVMEECHSMNVVLKDNMLILEGNDLSDIYDKSLAKLFRVIRRYDDRLVIHYSYNFFKWSDYSLTGGHLQKLVESVAGNMTLNLKNLDLSNINLSLISGKTLAWLFKISPHLTQIAMINCRLSGSFVNAVMKECHSMNVVLKNETLQLKYNDLSDIDGKSLAELVRLIDGYYFCYDWYPDCSWRYECFQWSDYSLTSDNLQKLVESVAENITLNWESLNLSKVNLSLISGKTLACLFKVSPDLIRIDMSNCRLSGSIVNAVIKECHSMNVVLKDKILMLNGNDLSDIEVKTLAELVGVIGEIDDIGHTGRYIVRWSGYSFTGDHLQKLVESVAGNMTLNWKILDLSKINLSLISGKTLACLFKISPHLTQIDMSNCSLSGSIVNALLEECHSMNVVLENNILLEGNKLSDIDGKSLANLIRVISQYGYNAFRWSDYSLTGDNLQKLVESVAGNMTLNWKILDLSNINLSLISGETLACLFKISPHLFKINMTNCRLSGSIVNAVMEECHSMNVVVKDKIVILKGNDLSDIDGKSLAKLIRVIHYSYNFFKWSDYSLTGDHLQNLIESVAGNMTLNWKKIDLSNISLSLISGKTLACLFKISPHLIQVDMSNCSLSGSIVNAVMEECHSMNVVLKYGILKLKNNDLSDIEIKSLAKLVRVIHDRYKAFRWSDYSLTGDHLQKLVESVAGNMTLNWEKLDLGYINLSLISSKTLACLFKIFPHLIQIDMSNCSLSGSIVNAVMEECHSMNVILKDGMLILKGNDLSDMEGKSLAKLVVRVIHDRYNAFRWSDYSLTGDHLQKLVESVAGNMTLNWGKLDLSYINLSLISGKTLACLFKVSPHLIQIDMSNCSLSGSIVNAVMEECHSMNVVLNYGTLILNGNDLSDIEGKSLAKLARVVHDRYNTFRWSDYSLTGDHLQKLVESVAGNMTLNWEKLDLSNINLSLISSKTLACLFKISPHLIKIDASNCSLSGSIVNAVKKECHSMNVVFKEVMLILEGNDLSDIDNK